MKQKQHSFDLKTCLEHVMVSLLLLPKVDKKALHIEHVFQSETKLFWRLCLIFKLWSVRAHEFLIFNLWELKELLNLISDLESLTICKYLISSSIKIKTKKKHVSKLSSQVFITCFILTRTI